MTHPTWTNTQIINQLDSGAHWSGSSLTYSFSTSVTWFPYGETSGFSALSGTQQTAATMTIRLWDDLIGADFTQVSGGTAANIEYMNTTTNIGYAHAYFPSTSWQGAGSIWFNSQYGSSSGTNNLMSPTVGNWGWGAYVHETGHALGLDHPGTYNGGSPTYANDALYAQDSQMYTIMSYFDASNTGADWSASDGRWYYAQTPMLHDIMTIQAMYGAETTTRTGNTTYGFHATADVWLYDFTQNLHPVLCIYDSAGVDTLDLSGWNSSCTINLTPGTYSNADMMTYNISIAYTAWIENGVGGGGNDTVIGNSIANQISGLGGNDTLDGGDGNDQAVFSGNRANYAVSWNAATSTFTLVDSRSGSPDGQDQVTNVESFRFADGTIAAADLLNTTVLGGGGGDSGGGGGDGGGSTTTGTSLADVLNGTTYDDVIYGYGGSDSLSGNAGNDLLDGGTGNDSMRGGAGNDTYVVDAAGDFIVESGSQGTDVVTASVSSYALADNIERLVYTGAANFTGTGNALANSLTGAGGNDSLNGLAGNDSLDGGTGNDLLDGGTGSDTLRGGAGNDTYAVDANADLIVENANEGTDLVRTTLSTYTLGDALENLTYTGTGNFVGNGNAGANVITGGGGGDTLNGLAGNDTLNGTSGNDLLDGGADDDSMLGGTGDDTYAVNSAGDVVVESSGGGTDLVRTGLSTYTLGNNIENLLYTGSSAFTGTGNSLANALTGGAGNDTLDGLAGNDLLDGGLGDDRMNGGIGNDTLVVNTVGDVVVENAGEGTDLVRTTLSTYGLGANVENLLYAGTSAFTGIGNSFANSLTGAGGHDTLSGLDGNDVLDGAGGNDSLDGGTGNDAMRGGAGNDTFVVDAAGDGVVESANEGTDFVVTALSTYRLGDNVENVLYTGAGNFSGTGNSLANTLTGAGGDDTIKGDAGNDVLVGAAGNDSLDGGTGNDAMRGGSGNDTYVVDAAGDSVIENANEGTDLVKISLSTYTLGNNVENLLYTGSANFTGTGNALANSLVAGSGNDTLSGRDGDDSLAGLAGADLLDGGTGADSMRGGAGNDTYVVDNAGDAAVENANEGTDLVRTTLTTYTLGADVENLTYTGTSAFTGTGNGLANVLTGAGGSDVLNGLDGNDLLDGGGGSDILRGGTGNDTCVVNAAGDSVVENANEGSDLVTTGLAAYTLAANVENLTYTGTSAFTGTGNALANILTGGGVNDTLNGLAGNDALVGSAGNDLLDGGADDDSMRGGAGDDTYVLNSAGDIVVENGGEGTDVVRTGVSAYTLGNNVENLLYTGLSAFTGTGNSLANLLTGGSANDDLSGLGGNDLLDGGLGDDMLRGGTGNDTFVVNSAGDVVVENASEGTDLVSTTLSSYTLADTIENLLYTGTAAFTGTGNNLANLLTGAGGADLLSGLGGNDQLVGNGGYDTLIGGAGVDTMSGGSGRDVFRLLASTDSGRGNSADVITDFSRNDGDRIDLAGIDANPSTGSDDLFSFIGTASFSGVAGQLRFANGVLYADLNGDRTSDFEIRMTGVTSLVAGDLIL